MEGVTGPDPGSRIGPQRRIGKLSNTGSVAVPVRRKTPVYQTLAERLRLHRSRAAAAGRRSPGAGRRDERAGDHL